METETETETEIETDPETGIETETETETKREEKETQLDRDRDKDTETDTDIHMGWLRSVGSIKLYVSFAEDCLFYRALLQKRPIILLILLTEATPYMNLVCDHIVIVECV